MRSLIVSIVIGPLMLIGAPHAAAGRSILPDRPILLAASSDAAADRDTYIQKARDDVQDWQQKLHDFGEKAEAKGQREGTAIENDLNKAWTKTKTEARKLQTASAEDWESAKVSYEKASHELTDAWHKIDGEDK